MPTRWDYLIVTAANDRQAAAYQQAIAARVEAGALAGAARTLVVPDIAGRRIGSGGSTLECLRTVLNGEGKVRDFAEVEQRLRGLRVLIVHAGGDSRRLPAYSACGKIFVPLPGVDSGPVVHTLFDRLIAQFSKLPAGVEGQVVVTSGDALVLFNASSVHLSKPGITALGAPAAPEEAARHGVFCVAGSGAVRLYLQKPSLAEQRATGAVNADGRTMLDIGIMSFSAGASAALLRTFCGVSPDRSLAWRPEYEMPMLDYGIDLYREICCAMGSEATLEGYLRGARGSGSKWPDELLSSLFPALREIPMHLEALENSRFLHFGSTRQLISSGLALIEEDTGKVSEPGAITLTTELNGTGSITGGPAWVEGCRIAAPVALAGGNVLVGIRVSEPLRLPEDACIDVLKGSTRGGGEGWFIRCYGAADTFKHSMAAGGTFCGLPLACWIEQAGLPADFVWGADTGAEDRTLWNARVFPAVADPEAYRRWLWMFSPVSAGVEEKRAFLEADRYSAAEVALLADQKSFYLSRQAIHAAARRG